MDCYRQVCDSDRARELSDEVIRVSTDFDGSERWPMRIAEAEITLGVVAARDGDLDEALIHRRRALTGGRKSLPSLSMVSRDLGHVLAERFASEPEGDKYLEEIRILQRPS